MKTRLFPYLALLAMLATATLVYFAVSAAAGRNQPAIKASTVAACSKPGRNHEAIIRNGAITPAATAAKLCDTLTINNDDAQVRLIAFGEHEHHTPYDGVIEKVLDKNQSFSVTLNQAGTFKFHDHLDDSAHGTFTVR